MKKSLILALLLLPTLSFGQKFYVSTDCDRCDVLITNKLNKLGYLTTGDSSLATYKINASFEKDRAYLSFKIKHQESGFLEFKNKDNQILDSTRIQGGNAAALNGFNAKADVVRKILKRDFYAIVKNLVAK